LREPEIGISAESTTINVNNTITTAGGNLNFTANTIVVPETGSLNANGGTIALTGDNIQVGEGRTSPEDGAKKLIQSEGGELIIQPRTFDQIVLGDDTENNPQALEITEEELSTLSNNFNQIEIILESGDIFIDGAEQENFAVEFLSPVTIEARNGSIISSSRSLRGSENASITLNTSNNIEFENRITVDRNIDEGLAISLNATGDNSQIITDTIITNGGDAEITVGNTTSANGATIQLGDLRTNSTDGQGQTSFGGNLTLNALGSNSLIETPGMFIATRGGNIEFNAPDGNIIIRGIREVFDFDFDGRIDFDDRIDFAGDVTIRSSRVTQINNEISANSITTDAGGITELNANITTTNNQIYNDAVTLTNNVILNSSAGNGNIEFNSTLNGNSNLQLNSGSGTITLGEVGDQNPLSSLTLNTTGQTNLGGNINVGELNINQPNIQLTSDVIIDVSTGTTGIDFGGGTVNGNFNLELIAGDNNIILGTVGENQPLSSLIANSSGLTTLEGNITTSGIDGVNFSDVTELNLINNINIDTSLGNGVINLDGGIIDGDFNLNLNAGSGEISLGQVGSNTPLNLLNIPTAGSVNLNGNLTTAENIDAGSGEISLGQVGSNTPLNLLNIPTAGSVNLNGNLTTAENIDFTNVIGGTQLNADITITSNNGNISFNGSPILGEGNTLTLDTQNEVSLDNVGSQGEEIGGLIVENAETVNLFGNIFTDGGIRFPTVTTINLNGDLITLETDSDNGNIDFSNTLVTGDSQLTINAGTGNIALGQVGTETNELGGLTIESATDINLSGDIFTNGGLDFSGTETVNLNVAEVRLQTRSDNGDINLSNTLVTGNSELTLNAGEAGEISLENVGNLNQPLESLILESAANVNLSGSIFTNGDLDFSGVPTVSLLGTDVVLQTLGNSGIVNLANSSINAAGEGLRNLTINTENGQVDLGAVGNQNPISSLTINSAGQTNLNGNITTSGTVNFSEASNVNLTSDIVIDSSLGNGNIDFNGGNIDGNFDLDLNANSGNITLGTVGNNIPLNNLTVLTSSLIELGGNLTVENLVDFSQVTGTIQLNTTETIITSNTDSILFNNSSITGAGNRLTLSATNQISLNNIGSNGEELGEASFQEANIINLSGAVFTNNGLDFSSAEIVNLNDAVTLETDSDNGNINLSNVVVEGAGRLTINAGEGNVELETMGENIPLSALTVNTKGETNLGGNITTSGTVNFSEASNVNLTSDIVIDSSLGNGNIDFNGGNIDGNFDLDLNANSGNITLGTVGSNIPLNDLTVNSTGTTSLNGTVNTESLVTNAGGITQINGNITTTGVLGQTYGDRLIILNNLILTGDKINFREPVSGNNFDLTLQPFNLNRSISLGNTVNFANSLNLTETELNLFQNGFNSLTIGSAETGQINILGNISFNDPVTGLNLG
jgi:hypothetical protein